MRRGTSQPSSARTPSECSSSKYSLAANAIGSLSRLQMHLSLPISPPPRTAKTMPLFLQSSLIWSAFGWMSCLLTSSKRWSYRKMPARWMCSSPFCLVWRNWGRGYLNSGPSLWNLTISRANSCQNLLRESRNAKNWSQKLLKMPQGKNSRVAQGILNKT